MNVDAAEGITTAMHRAVARSRIALLAASAALLTFAVANAAWAQSRGDRGPRASAPALAPTLVELGQARFLAIARSSSKIQLQLRAARNGRAARAAVCLDDNLSQAHAVQRWASLRLRLLRTASRQGDTTRARYELGVLTILVEHADLLSERARGCGGRVVATTGATTVTVYIDPRVPDVDIGLPRAPLVSVPPKLSPRRGRSAR